MPNLSTICRPASGPMVIDLRGHQGNYESSPHHPAGHRTFGLWSMSSVQVGDLIIKPVVNKPHLKALYKVTEAKRDFQSNGGDDYYRGVMIDVMDSCHRLGVDPLTKEDHAALANET